MTAVDDIEYSEKYCDEYHEYRHVILPKEICKLLPAQDRLLTEEEWRSVGVQQSRGWVHYMCHSPEPHILLFRRPMGTDPRTGKVPDTYRAPATEGQPKKDELPPDMVNLSVSSEDSDYQ
eukprot:297_1